MACDRACDPVVTWFVTGFDPSLEHSASYIHVFKSKRYRNPYLDYDVACSPDEQISQA